MSLLVFKDVEKSYSSDVTAVKQVSFTIHEGEFTALAGPSGSGKSTMLNLAAGLDLPNFGTVTLLGKDISELSANQLSTLRRDSVGFIFQAYNLFPVLSAIENVEYTLALKGVPVQERQARAMKALEEVGMTDLANRFPAQLSGGQQQRVAIARAIVSRPKIVFADEPTANLDSRTSEKLLVLFNELNQEKGITFLFSSHDPMVLKLAGRTLEVADGEIRSDSYHARRKTGLTLIKGEGLTAEKLEVDSSAAPISLRSTGS